QPVGVVRRLVLIELDGVDPQLGGIVQRPGAAVAQLLLARRRGVLGEVVLHEHSAERLAEAVGRGVLAVGTGGAGRPGGADLLRGQALRQHGVAPGGELHLGRAVGIPAAAGEDNQEQVPHEAERTYWRENWQPVTRNSSSRTSVKARA